MSTILSQAASLGLFPFLAIKHTSVHYEHQIYSRSVTIGLCLACLFVLGTFQHSSNLTAVYGACVSSASACPLACVAFVYVFLFRL